VEEGYMTNIKCLIYSDIELPDSLSDICKKDPENETSKLKVVVVKE
jgi:hypothetical protein